MQRIDSRAFTLIEVVVVMVMVGILAVAVLPRFSQDSRVGGDITARASVEAAVGSVATMFEQTQRFPTLTSIDDMVKLQDIAGRIRVVTSESTGPRVVSLHVTGDVVVAAAQNEGTCFWLRRDFFADADTSVYGISATGGDSSCEAASGQLIDRENGRGGSWAKPVEVETA